MHSPRKGTMRYMPTTSESLTLTILKSRPKHDEQSVA